MSSVLEGGSISFGGFTEFKSIYILTTFYMLLILVKFGPQEAEIWGFDGFSYTGILAKTFPGFLFGFTRLGGGASGTDLK